MRHILKRLYVCTVLCEAGKWTDQRSTGLIGCNKIGTPFFHTYFHYSAKLSPATRIIFVEQYKSNRSVHQLISSAYYYQPIS